VPDQLGALLLDQLVHDLVAHPHREGQEALAHGPGQVVDGELYLAWEVDAVKLFAPCDPGAVVLLHGWRSSSWIGFLPLSL